LLINTNYYAISKIDGNDIWLLGTDEIWKTTGTPLTFDILNYQKIPVSIAEREYPPTQGMDFPLIDRRGNEVITSVERNDPPMAALSALAFEEWVPETEITESIPEGGRFSIRVGQPDVPLTAIVAGLNAASQDQIVEVVNQNEGITFSIKLK